MPQRNPSHWGRHFVAPSASGRQFHSFPMIGAFWNNSFSLTSSYLQEAAFTAPLIKSISYSDTAALQNKKQTKKLCLQKPNIWQLNDPGPDQTDLTHPTNCDECEQSTWCQSWKGLLKSWKVQIAHFTEGDTEPQNQERAVQHQVMLEPKSERPSVSKFRAVPGEYWGSQYHKMRFHYDWAGSWKKIFRLLLTSI